MPIYDNDGTTSYEIGKVYDINGTTLTQLGKAYDNDGTALTEIWSAEYIIFDNGVLNTSLVKTHGETTSGGGNTLDLNYAQNTKIRIATSTTWGYSFSTTRSGTLPLDEYSTMKLTVEVSGIGNGGGGENFIKMELPQGISYRFANTSLATITIDIQSITSAGVFQIVTQASWNYGSVQLLISKIVLE